MADNGGEITFKDRNMMKYSLQAIFIPPEEKYNYKRPSGRSTKIYSCVLGARNA